MTEKEREAEERQEIERRLSERSESPTARRETPPASLPVCHGQGAAGAV